MTAKRTDADALFQALTREFALRMDRQIEREDREWSDRVPESMDRMAAGLLSGSLPAVYIFGEPTVIHSAKRLARRASRALAVRITAVALAASAAVGAGGYAASPALRETVSAVLTAQRSETAPERTPGEYVIPSPGEGFSVTDEAVGTKTRGCWFTSADREMLVQIACRLPEGAELSDDAELLFVDDVPAYYEQTDTTRVLLLRDGGVLIRIEIWGAEQEELIDYARRLLEANR